MEADIFTRNMEILRRFRPELDIWRNFKPMPDIVVEDAVNGVKTLRFETDTGKMYVHSRYNPHNEPDVPQLLYDSRIVVFGMGLGYRLTRLVNNLNPYSRVLVVEPSRSAFYYALLYNAGMADALCDSRIIFAVGCEAAVLKEKLGELADRYEGDLITVISAPAYSAKFPAELAGLNEAVRRLRDKYRVEGVTIRSQNALWKLNSMQNIRHLPQSARFWSFNGELMNIPAAVVSAGPSLDKNAHLLAESKGRVFIVAAHTALNTLKKHGVSPHVVVSVDTRQLIRETDEQLKAPLDLPLLYVLQTDSRLLNKAENVRKIFGLRADDVILKNMYDQLGHKEGYVFPSGSVVMSALDFAAICGCNPIMLVGQDLAFTGLKGHADGISEGPLSSLDEKLKDAFQVEDVFGGRVYTDSAFDLYRRILEDYIEYDSEAFGRLFIDATEGGAKIRGARVMALKDALAACAGSIRTGEATRLFDAVFRTENLVFGGDTGYVHRFTEAVDAEREMLLGNSAVSRLAARVKKGQSGEPEIDLSSPDALLSDAISGKEAIEAASLGFGLDYQYARGEFALKHGEAYAAGDFAAGASAAERYAAKQAVIAFYLTERLMNPPEAEF